MQNIGMNLGNSENRFRRPSISGVKDDTGLNIIDVKMRAKFQRPDGKAAEPDVLAESDCGKILAVEVKKTKEPSGPVPAADFFGKARCLCCEAPGKNIDSGIFFRRRVYSGRAGILR